MTLSEALRHYVGCWRAVDAGFLGASYLDGAETIVRKAELSEGVGRFHDEGYDSLCGLAPTGALVSLADDVDDLGAQAAYKAWRYRVTP